MAETATPTPTVLTPDQELAKIQSDPSFAGGQYYGRVPNGIADLVKGGLVGSASPAQGSGPAPGTTNPDGTIASSTVRRYTGPVDSAGKPETADATTASARTAGGTYTGIDGKSYYKSDGTPVSTTNNPDGSPIAPDVNAIRQSALTDAQGQVDAIKTSAATEVAAAQEEGVNNLGKGRAIEARGGILGSDFGNAQQSRIQGNTDAKVAAINAKMNAAISAVLTHAQDRGDTLAQNAITEADKTSTTYLATLKANRDATRADVTALAKSGVPLSSLTNDEYNSLVQHTGYDAGVFNAVYNASLPQSQQRKYTYEKMADGSILPIYTDPVSGLPKAEAPLNVPKTSGGGTFDGFMVAPDGTPIFYNKATGEAKVANVSGTTDTNFGKTPAPTPGTKPTATQVKADKIGTSWLKSQKGFTAADLEAYNSDPVFHEKVNNAAAAATKTPSSSSGGRSI